MVGHIHVQKVYVSKKQNYTWPDKGFWKFFAIRNDGLYASLWVIGILLELLLSHPHPKCLAFSTLKTLTNQLAFRDEVRLANQQWQGKGFGMYKAFNVIPINTDKIKHDIYVFWKHMSKIKRHIYFWGYRPWSAYRMTFEDRGVQYIRAGPSLRSPYPHPHFCIAVPLRQWHCNVLMPFARTFSCTAFSERRQSCEPQIILAILGGGITIVISKAYQAS